MPRRQPHNRAQFALGLEHPLPPSPAVGMASPEGLLAVLADLLLSALGAEAMTMEGSGDERQDHT